MTRIDDPELDRELVDLFRPRRPDPRAFREAVERRIAGRAAAPRTPDASGRRAAGALPFDPVSAATASALAGKGAVKIAGAFGVPLGLIAATLVSFVLALVSIARFSRGAKAPPDASERGAARAGQTFGVLLMAVIPFAPMLALWVPELSTRYSDLLLLVLLYSIAVLTTSVRWLARSGLWSRLEMARLGASVLLALYAGSYFWMGGLLRMDSSSELGLGWCATVVVAGASGCMVVATGAQGRAWIGVGFTVVLGLLVRSFSPPLVGDGAGRLREELQHFHGRVDDLAGWNEAAARFEALRAAGEELPSLERVRRGVEEAIEEGGLERFLWRPASRMGLIDAGHWLALAERPIERHALDDLLRADGPLLDLVEREPYFAMLLASRPLAPAEVEHLAGRVVASWPLAQTVDPLEHAAVCVRLLDGLRRADLADSLREQAHGLLRSHWVDSAATRTTQVGGFATNPRRFGVSSAPEPTWHAIELLARFGCPAEIDLRRVRGHLLAWRTFSLVSRRHDPSGDVTAFQRAALLRLERDIGMPERTWWLAALDERLPIASALLVILCWFGIAVARPAAPEVRGALP